MAVVEAGRSRVRGRVCSQTGSQEAEVPVEPRADDFTVIKTSERVAACQRGAEQMGCVRSPLSFRDSTIPETAPRAARRAGLTETEPVQHVQHPN